MSLLIRIDIWVCTILLPISFCLYLRDVLDGDTGDYRARVGLRSARKRLSTRLIKSEIRSTTRRLRRELDEQFNQVESDA
jgi:hypothetical protein